MCVYLCKLNIISEYLGLVYSKVLDTYTCILDTCMRKPRYVSYMRRPNPPRTSTSSQTSCITSPTVRALSAHAAAHGHFFCPKCPPSH